MEPVVFWMFQMNNEEIRKALEARIVVAASEGLEEERVNVLRILVFEFEDLMERRDFLPMI